METKVITFLTKYVVVFLLVQQLLEICSKSNYKRPILGMRSVSVHFLSSEVCTVVTWHSNGRHTLHQEFKVQINFTALGNVTFPQQTCIKSTKNNALNSFIKNCLRFFVARFFLFTLFCNI